VKDKEKQLQTVVAFFKRENQKQLVENNRNRAEFVAVSKNVKASVKFQGGAKQDVSIELKRYRASIGDQTIQGDWMVEKVLQP